MDLALADFSDATERRLEQYRVASEVPGDTDLEAWRLRSAGVRDPPDHNRE